MASKKFKSICQWTMGTGYKYYRLLYSMVALISLGFVLSRQFSLSSSELKISPWLRLFLGVPFGIFGTCLMAASIRKYFLSHSGIGVFLPDKNTVILQFHGVHQFVRHPLYLGTLLLIWTIFLYLPFLSNLLACVVINSYTLIGIRFEERKLMTIFGKAYKSYCDKTPRLIPKFRLR